MSVISRDVGKALEGRLGVRPRGYFCVYSCV